MPHIHPKTLIEMWITCLDWVSANSEKGVGCKGGAEIAVEIRAERSSPRIESDGSVGIRGGLPSTWPFEPVFGWRGRSVLRDYRHGLFFRTACYKLYIVEVMVCS